MSTSVMLLGMTENFGVLSNQDRYEHMCHVARDDQSRLGLFRFGESLIDSADLSWLNI